MLVTPERAIVAPALIRLRRKSITNPSAEDACIASAVQAHRGCDWTMPVVFGGEIVGVVRGERLGPRVTFTRIPRSIWAAGYTTYDSIIAACSAGQRLPNYWSKTHTTAPVANNWYDSWTLGGFPSAGAFAGAASTAVQFSDTTTGSLYVGGNVSPSIKAILNCWAFGTAGVPPPVIVIYDRVLAYEANVHNNTVNKAMTNTLTAQRYVSAGQSGMRIFVTCQTLQGATATNLTQLRYTNQLGTTLQTMPTSPTVAFIVSATAPTATLGARVICPATAAATLPWGYSLPLAVGDSGVRLINDFTDSSANTGTFTFILGRPLFTIGTATAGVVSQLDGIYQIASLEQIFDGACITFLFYFPVATAATLQGEIDVGWN